MARLSWDAFAAVDNTEPFSWCNCEGGNNDSEVFGFCRDCTLPEAFETPTPASNEVLLTKGEPLCISKVLFAPPVGTTGFMLA